VAVQSIDTIGIVVRSGEAAVTVAPLCGATQTGRTARSSADLDLPVVAGG
jgi:hypothetical protein